MHIFPQFWMIHSMQTTIWTDMLHMLAAPYKAVSTHCCMNVCHRVNVKPFKVMLGTIAELEKRYIIAAPLLLPFTMIHHLMVGFLKQQAIRWDTLLVQSSQPQLNEFKPF